MADEIRIVSTTDSEADVRAALGLAAAPATPAVPAEPATPAPAAVAAPPAAAAPPAKPATDDDDDTPVDAPVDPASEAGAAMAKRKGKLQARIDELVWSKSETQRERDDARRELVKLRDELETLKKGAAPTEPTKAAEPLPIAQAPEPKEEDFGSYNEYIKALAKWTNDQDIAKLRADFEAEKQRLKTEREAEQRRAVVEEGQRAYNERAKAARGRHADYDTVMGSTTVQITQPMRDHIQHSDVGPDLAYYFASNPEEAERISKLTPGPALVAMGRLEERLESKGYFEAPKVSDTRVETTEAPTKVPVSQAPPPMQRVAPGVTVHEKNPDSMTHAEFKAWREKHRRRAS